MISSFFIQQVAQAIIALIFWYILIFLLRKIISWRKLKRFFDLWKVILVLSVLATITLITNPLQTYYIVVIAALLLRYLSNYLFKSSEIPTEDERKGKHIYQPYLMMLVFFVWVVVVGYASPIADTSFSRAWNTSRFMVNNANAIVYDVHDGGVYDIGSFDTNQDGKYDRIMHDLNKDGKADIVQIDTNFDGEIDDVQAISYTKQQRFIFILMCILAIIALLRSKRWKKQPPISIFIVILGVWLMVSWTSYAQMPEGRGADLEEHQWCVSNPYDTSACAWLPAESILFLKHMLNPTFSAEAEGMIDSWVDCGRNCSEAQQAQLESDSRAFWNKRKDITPTPPAGIPSVEQPVPTDEPAPDTNTEDTSNDEGEEKWFDDEDVEEDLDDNDWIDEDENPEDTVDDDMEDIVDDDDIEDEFDEEDFEEDFDDDDWDEENEESVVPLPSQMEDPPKTPPITVKDIADKTKAITDITKGIMEWSDLVDDVKAFNQWQKIDTQNIDQIQWKIDDLLGKTGLKVDDVVNDLRKDLSALEWKNAKNYTDRAKDNPTDGKRSKVVQWLSVAGTVLDAYVDYQDFDKAFGGDATKATNATTMTSIGKTILWANPVDLTMWLVTAGLKLIGKDDRAAETDKFQAGSIFKEAVLDGYTTDMETMGRVFVDQATEIKWARANSNYNVVEKVGVSLNGWVTILYGAWAMALGGIMEISEWPVGAFTDGVKEIGSRIGW